MGDHEFSQASNSKITLKTKEQGAAAYVSQIGWELLGQVSSRIYGCGGIIFSGAWVFVYIFP